MQNWRVSGKSGLSPWLRVACAILVLTLDAPAALAPLPAVPDYAASQDESPSNPTPDDAEGEGGQAPDESNDLTRPVLQLLDRRERRAVRLVCLAVTVRHGRARAWSPADAPAKAVRLPILLCRLTC